MDGIPKRRRYLVASSDDVEPFWEINWWDGEKRTGKNIGTNMTVRWQCG